MMEDGDPKGYAKSGLMAMIIFDMYGRITCASPRTRFDMFFP